MSNFLMKGREVVRTRRVSHALGHQKEQRERTIRKLDAKNVLTGLQQFRIDLIRDFGFKGVLGRLRTRLGALLPSS